MDTFTVIEWSCITSGIIFFLLLALWFIDFGGFTQKLKLTRIGQLCSSRWLYRLAFIVLCLTPLTLAEIYTEFIEYSATDNAVSAARNVENVSNLAATDEIELERIQITGSEKVFDVTEPVIVIISTLLFAFVLPFPVFSVQSQSKNDKLLISPFDKQKLFFPSNNQVQRLFTMLFFALAFVHSIRFALEEKLDSDFYSEFDFINSWLSIFFLVASLCVLYNRFLKRNSVPLIKFACVVASVVMPFEQMIYIVSMLTSIEVEFNSVLTEYFPYNLLIDINENFVQEYDFTLQWQLLLTLSVYGLILKSIRYGELKLAELFTKRAVKRQIYALLLLSFSNLFIYTSDWGSDIGTLASCIAVIIYYVTHIYVVIGAYTGYSDKTNQWFDIFYYWYGHSFFGWVLVSSVYYWSYLSDDGGWDENSGALLEPTVNVLLICISYSIIQQTLANFHSANAELRHYSNLKAKIGEAFDALGNLGMTTCIYGLMLLFYWTVQILVINL